MYLLIARYSEKILSMRENYTSLELLHLTLSNNLEYSLDGLKFDALSFSMPPVIHQLPSEKVKLAAIEEGGNCIFFFFATFEMLELLAQFRRENPFCTYDISETFFIKTIIDKSEKKCKPRIYQF